MEYNKPKNKVNAKSVGKNRRGVFGKIRSADMYNKLYQKYLNKFKDIGYDIGVVEKATSNDVERYLTARLLYKFITESDDILSQEDISNVSVFSSWYISDVLNYLKVNESKMSKISIADMMSDMGVYIYKAFFSLSKNNKVLEDEGMFTVIKPIVKALSDMKFGDEEKENIINSFKELMSNSVNDLNDIKYRAISFYITLKYAEKLDIKSKGIFLYISSIVAGKNIQLVYDNKNKRPNLEVLRLIKDISGIDLVKQNNHFFSNIFKIYANESKVFSKDDILKFLEFVKNINKDLLVKKEAYDLFRMIIAYDHFAPFIASGEDMAKTLMTISEIYEKVKRDILPSDSLLDDRNVMKMIKPIILGLSRKPGFNPSKSKKVVDRLIDNLHIDNYKEFPNFKYLVFKAMCELPLDIDEINPGLEVYKGNAIVKLIEGIANMSKRSFYKKERLDAFGTAVNSAIYFIATKSKGNVSVPMGKWIFLFSHVSMSMGHSIDKWRIAINMFDLINTLEEISDLTKTERGKVLDLIINFSISLHNTFGYDAAINIVEKLKRREKTDWDEVERLYKFISYIDEKVEEVSKVNKAQFMKNEFYITLSSLIDTINLNVVDEKVLNLIANFVVSSYKAYNTGRHLYTYDRFNELLLSFVRLSLNLSSKEAEKQVEIMNTIVDKLHDWSRHKEEGNKVINKLLSILSKGNTLSGAFVKKLLLNELKGGSKIDRLKFKYL